MGSTVRIFLGVLAVAVVGCGSSNHGGRSGTGGNGGGSQGNGGATVSSVSNGGNGGGLGNGGMIGSTGTVGSGGTSDSGDTIGKGGNSSGPVGSGGVAGGAGGGTSAFSDAGASYDAAADDDAPACPVCLPAGCVCGSPLDSNGCTMCTCNPAFDGGVDVSTDSSCGLPEGCADTGRDTGIQSEAGAKADVIRFDGTGLKCGNIVCAWGERCCGLEGGGLSPSTPWCGSGDIVCI